MLVELVVGAMEVLAMVALSVNGNRRLPADARVQVQWAGRWGNFQSKQAGLITYPVTGAGIFVVFTILLLTVQPHGRESAFAPGIFLPIVLCVILLTQIAAIEKARRAAEAR